MGEVAGAASGVQGKEVSVEVGVIPSGGFVAEVGYGEVAGSQGIVGAVFRCVAVCSSFAVSGEAFEEAHEGEHGAVEGVGHRNAQLGQTQPCDGDGFGRGSNNIESATAVGGLLYFLLERLPVGVESGEGAGEVFGVDGGAFGGADGELGSLPEPASGFLPLAKGGGAGEVAGGSLWVVAGAHTDHAGDNP